MMTDIGAQLEWTVKKGDYNTGGASTVITVNLGPVRFEQLGQKQIDAENFPNAATTIESDTDYPLLFLMDFGMVQQTFRINGTLLNSGTDYAYDKKNRIITMFESCRTGSLYFNFFSSSSGTDYTDPVEGSNGSESWQVNFIDYNFLHDKAGIDRTDFQLTLITGSEMY